MRRRLRSKKSRKSKRAIEFIPVLGVRKMSLLSGKPNEYSTILLFWATAALISLLSGCGGRETAEKDAEAAESIVKETLSPPGAESPLPPTKGSTDAGPGQQKLVRVSTINGIKANSEFLKNVQLVQAQRQNIIALNTQLEQTSDSEARSNIQIQIDKALDKLNENNRKMVETYGFSLLRNYVFVREKAHVYMAVSEEEANRIEARQRN